MCETGDLASPGINGAFIKRHNQQKPMTKNISADCIDDAMKKVEEGSGQDCSSENQFIDCRLLCFL